VEIQGARLTAEDRSAVDVEVEALLDAAAGFALESAHPDPASAFEYLYASPEVLR
jgi:pyruvate dehydrogenase E1 component alpha subunit